MKEHITPNDIANEVRMKRTQHAGAFLIVEGGDDGRLYGNFIDQKKCRIVIAQGRENAVQALAILEQDRVPGVLTIVDADFWILEKTLPTSSNLLLTDTHDLETMIIKSPALDKIISEFGHAGKISNLKRDIRTLLIESGIDIGFIRLINSRTTLSLDFKYLSFNKFVDVRTLNVNIPELVRILKARSHVRSIDESDIQSQINTLKNEEYDPWQVCCGHDLVNILSIGLTRLMGSANAKSVDIESLEKNLRLAYESSYFFTTEVCKKIKVWEIANKPYKVLA